MESVTVRYLLTVIVKITEYLPVVKEVKMHCSASTLQLLQVHLK